MSTPLIWRRNQYHDDKGHTIIEREIVGGIPPADFERYIGQGEVSIGLSTGQRISRPVRIRLPRARTVQEAFAQIDDEGERQRPEATEAILKELGLTTIAKPTPAEANRILRRRGPNDAAGLRR